MWMNYTSYLFNLINKLYMDMTIDVGLEISYNKKTCFSIKKMYIITARLLYKAIFYTLIKHKVFNSFSDYKVKISKGTNYYGTHMLHCNFLVIQLLENLLISLDLILLRLEMMSM